MEWWILLLILAIGFLLWRIHRENSSMDLPFYDRDEKVHKNFLDENSPTSSNLAVDHSQDDDDIFTNPLYRNIPGNIHYGSSLIEDDYSEASRDIYTDPLYCHLPGNIYYHICHDE